MDVMMARKTREKRERKTYIDALSVSQVFEAKLSLVPVRFKKTFFLEKKHCELATF